MCLDIPSKVGKAIKMAGVAETKFLVKISNFKKHWTIPNLGRRHTGMPAVPNVATRCALEMQLWHLFQQLP